MIKFVNYPEFNPNYTPAEMTALGVFGGNYFAKEHYNKNYDFPVKKFIIDLSKKLEYSNDIAYLLCSAYDKNKNHFKVQCGSSLEQWQDRDWIFERDPYGWYEWYIKFYYGIRDKKIDLIQINRWISFKARHGGMLKSHCRPNEINKSLKTRQNLLHWAIDSTKI